jgi:primosomal protein N' (replication factor Y) (superfamily II helicase)
VRGWVLGDTREVPARMLAIRKVVSPVRFFDATSLELLRWVSVRYVAPLATVIGRSHPPRVVSEEAVGVAEPVPDAAPGAVPSATPPADGPLEGYRGGADLLGALRHGSGASVLRPAPEEEAAVALQAVAQCLAGGRRAIVLVPEASPLPITARLLAEALGDRVAVHLGGDRRARYRSWLAIGDGRHDVVVGTHSSVFTPLTRVGLIYVARESHAAHREDRAPYYHVRDVALARARLDDAVCVLSALCPSSEAAALELPAVAPAGRRWPPVEVVKPGPEGRAPRLVRALRGTTRGFLYAPLPGYGIAQVCRSCGAPAACVACGGVLRLQDGAVRCVVCEAPGRCASCRATDFGIRRGGAERVEEWATSIASVPVRRPHRPRPPRDREILVGGPEFVRDLGPLDLDLVAILDADLAERRPGIGARERALATWMEAVGWARPHGRAIVQASHANDPGVQALVRGNPERFHRDEAGRRRDAGFPVGAAVFRVAGGAELPDRLATLDPITLLASSIDEGTVCLIALVPPAVPVFGTLARELAAAGVITRVEAEPHL